MFVGACRILLHLPENQSLKGKRQTLQSLMSRVRAQFHVAIAEVDHMDRWQLAALGIACVSNQPQHAEEMLSKVVRFIESARVEAEMTEVEIEIMPMEQN